MKKIIYGIKFDECHTIWFGSKDVAEFYNGYHYKNKYKIVKKYT